MATKTHDPTAALKQIIAEARKKPVSFAMLMGPKGLVVEADKKKSAAQMRKAAKAAGGGAKGVWGTMTVQQKTLVLCCEGDPPGGFDKQIKKHFSDAGVAMQVQFTSPEADTPLEEAAPAPQPKQARPETEAEAPNAEGDEDGDADLVDLGAILKLARKRPLNFACMLSDGGVVLVAHRLKGAGILVKQAKAQGGSAKGGWGTLSVEGKTVVLNCLDEVPGTLARRLKEQLKTQGLKFTVTVRTPSGEASVTDEEVAPGAPGHTPAPTPTPRANGDAAPSAGGSEQAVAAAPSLDDHSAEALRAQAVAEGQDPDAAERAYVLQRNSQIMGALKSLASKSEMAAFKAQQTELQKLLRAKDLKAARAIVAGLYRAQQDMEHRGQVQEGLGIAPERATALEAWIDANHMAEAGGVFLAGNRLMGDEVGGERLAAALKDSSDLGALTDEEKSYLAHRVLRKWVHSPDTGEDGADENIRELTEAMKGTDMAHGLAKVYWHTFATNSTIKVVDFGISEDAPVFEKRDLSNQLMESTLDLSPTAATQELAKTLGGNGLAQLAMGEMRKETPGGKMVYADIVNNTWDAFSVEHQQILLREVADGALNVEQGNAFTSFMFGAMREDALENPKTQQAWAHSLSTTLARNNCVVPALQEKIDARLQETLSTDGGRELLFNDKVPAPMRNWAVNHFAEGPPDWSRQPWTAEDVKDGWESKKVGEAFAEKSAEQAKADFPVPVSFDMKTQKGDLARNFAGIFSYPPTTPKLDGESEEAYQERIAKMDPDALYDTKKAPMKVFFEHIDKLTASGDLDASDVKITPIPVTHTSNETGPKVVKVIRMETKNGPLFFDHLNNRYPSAKDWLTENKFPAGRLSFPKDLVLGNPIVSDVSPANPILDGALMALDATVMVAGTIAGVAAIAGSGGAALPVVAGAAAAYGTARAGWNIHEQHKLGHDVGDLSDPDVRAMWLDLGSNALSIGALSGAKVISFAAKGSRVSKVGANVVAGMTVAGNLTDAAAMGNSVLALEAKWSSMTEAQKTMALLQMSMQVGMKTAGAKKGGGRFRDDFDFKRIRNQLDHGSPFELKPVTDDPELPPGAIQVKYDDGVDGLPTNLRIVYNGDTPPSAAQIQLHSQAAAAMEASVRLEKSWFKLGRVNEFQPGSAGWEAKLEVSKIRGEAKMLSEQLKRPDLTPDDELRLQSRMDELNGALASEQARLDAASKLDADDGGLGRGFVASPSGGETQRKKLGWPEAEDGYMWVASSDGTPFVRRKSAEGSERRFYDPDKKAFVLYADRPDANMRVVGHGENEMTFLTRGDGKTAEAHATLRKFHIGADRSLDELAAQDATRAKGKPGDDAGHVIGHRFGLDQGMDNMFPQDANFNRGAYKTMENEMAEWIAIGGEVRVSITTSKYDGDRPAKVSVRYEVVDPKTGVSIIKRSEEFGNNGDQTYKRMFRDEMEQTMDAKNQAAGM